MTRRYTKAELARYRAAQADRIAHLRKRLKLTQAEMALLVGVDRRSLHRWEQGLSAPTGSALVVLRALELEGTVASAMALVRKGGLQEIVWRALHRERVNEHGKETRKAAKADDGDDVADLDA